MNSVDIVELLDNLVREEGVIENIIENVDLFRISSSSPRLPQSYDPGIIILAQGQKKIFVGDEVFLYDPLNYLVLSVPLPIECETTASPGKPMLGLKIKTDAKIVGEIILTIDDAGQSKQGLPRGIYSAPLDNQLTDATVRLLKALTSPSDSRYLGPLIVREIIYRVISGEKGEALRQLAYRNQRFFQIARTLDRIHKSYSKKIDLNSLALETGMSISAFHASFKAVTSMAPLQYIKNVRLHKARMLMIEEGANAYSAAIHVGYESPSQFNREYKRLFGLTPGKDAISSERRL